MENVAFHKTNSLNQCYVIKALWPCSSCKVVTALWPACTPSQTLVSIHKGERAHSAMICLISSLSLLSVNTQNVFSLPVFMSEWYNVCFKLPGKPGGWNDQWLEFHPEQNHRVVRWTWPIDRSLWLHQNGEAFLWFGQAVKRNFQVSFHIKICVLSPFFLNGQELYWMSK